MAVMIYDKTLGKLVEKPADVQPELEIHTLGNSRKAREFRKLARSSRHNRGPRGDRKRARYPITCALNGVTKPQVAEAREAAKKAGLQGVDYAENGNVIWADQKARKDYIRHMGLRDNSGYY